MNSQISSSTAILVCSFCILIGLINIPPCQSDSLYASCSSRFSCGNINVSYPFWGGNRAYECGYDQLKLACEDGVAKIDIANVKYRLLDYNPKNQVMRIARDDYASGLCSTNYANTTLDPTLFELVNGYISLSLLYGCPTSGLPSFLGHFTCSVSGISNSDGYVMLGSTVFGSMVCFASVVVPVSEDLLKSLGNSSSSLESDLRRGFEVRLKVGTTSCDACLQSKGVCGYDHSANQTTCYCENQSSGSETCSYTAPAEAPQGQPTNGSVPRTWPIISAVGAAVVLLVIIITIITIWYRRGCKLSVSMDQINVEGVVLDTHGFLAPRRYKYSELKKMTNSFTEKIGQGGFGTVYKGMLPSGKLVAVKLLVESQGNGEEFINEVVSISRTAHVNVVCLLGFCYQRNKRALIYEFMPNGSLDKFIQPEGALHTGLKIDWQILHQIAIGIARGLEYLHRGCKSRILHFDIKPQNILLDEDFVPKISDFGLAKLCLGNESIVSLLGIRGTVGYIAPEVFSRSFGQVSHKADVYSYGMLVLSMVCGKSINNNQLSHSSDLYFPHYIYKQLEPNRDFKFQGIVTAEEEEIARKLIIVSFWCIQTNPSYRPTISKVIDMLEGSLHSMKMPPEPFLSDPVSQRRNLALGSPSSSSNRDDEKEESSLGDL